MAVDIEIFAYSRSTEQQWDIGDICEQIKIDWKLEDNAGTMDITCVKDNDIDLVEGDVVSLRVDGVNFFYGWVFKKEMNAYDSVSYKIYDVKRYLAYKDVDVTGNETVDECFTRVCTMANIEHKVVHTSDYIIPGKIHDGESYNNMLQFAMDHTFVGTGKRFCMRANGKVLELVDCSQQQTDIIIGDQSLLMDYKYSSDIENTYTAFKVQREVASESDKKKKKSDGLTETQKVLLRKTLVSQNEENIKKWGVLQYYEKKDSKWTDAQLAQHLQLLENAYSRQTRSLKLECIGDLECIPGNMITVLISDLEKEEVAQGTPCLITSATHTFTHNDHVMNLEVEVF